MMDLIGGAALVLGGGAALSWHFLGYRAGGRYDRWRCRQECGVRREDGIVIAVYTCDLCRGDR